MIAAAAPPLLTPRLCVECVNRPVSTRANQLRHLGWRLTAPGLPIIDRSALRWSACKGATLPLSEPSSSQVCRSSRRHFVSCHDLKQASPEQPNKLARRRAWCSLFVPLLGRSCIWFGCWDMLDRGCQLGKLGPRRLSTNNGCIAPPKCHAPSRFNHQPTHTIPLPYYRARAKPWRCGRRRWA